MGQLFPTDYRRFGGIFGLLETISDHEGKCISDVAYLLVRQERIRWHVQSSVWQLNRAWQKAEIGCLTPGEYKAHRRHRPRSGSIDLKARMRVGRS
jgi:hypothetical protein